MNKLVLAASAMLVTACATTPDNPGTTVEAPPPTTFRQAQTGAPPARPAEPAAPAAVDTTPIPFRPLKTPPPMDLVILPSPNDPIVNFRLVFHSGSVDDPKGKEGLTALTALVMEEGGTVELPSAELLKALFPMAGEISAMTSEEFTTFSGRVHKDNVDRFFQIFADVVMRPRWDPKEFERLRTDAVNAVKNRLRSEDDEELGKVALASVLYAGHPYEKHVGGTVKGLQAITLDDVKAHAAKVFTQDRLVIGLGGAVDDALAARVKQKLSALPATGAPRVQLPAVPPQHGRAIIVQKPTISTAVSLGYPYALRRGDPDFHPLVFALSYLGEHRQSTGLLYNELREKRGMNYGNYAYPEHFVQEGYGSLALPNVGRAQPYFSIWIRPVEPANAVFATRGAVYFLQKMIDEGIPKEAFEMTRGFLGGYTRTWDLTQQRRLGYAIDDRFYGTGGHLEALRKAIATLTPEQVQAAVRRHLDPRRLAFAFVTQDADKLKAQLASGAPTPIQYPTPKSPEVLEEDKKIAGVKLPIDPQKIEVVPASSFMEQ